jgi:hypothetical protein
MSLFQPFETKFETGGAAETVSGAMFVEGTEEMCC